MKHSIAIASVMLAACAAAHDKTGVAPPTRIPDVVEHVAGPVGTPVPAAAVPKVVRRAVVADAAKRFSVPESDVVIVHTERVTWPDAALGCPEPGKMYTQALVPGYRLAAKTAQGELRYHTDTAGLVVSCAP